MIELLNIKGYSYLESLPYIEAYDYFCINKKQFDGATIVKDLDDLPNLDLDAMLHDYQYIKGLDRNFLSKLKVDWQFAKGMERKGKGVFFAYFKFILLTLTSPIWVLFKRLKKW